MKRIRDNLWYWVLRHFPSQEYSLCANRRTSRVTFGPIEVTITCRDTREPDGYERTELYRMLHLIRSEEIRQNWKVPEPVNSDFVRTVVS
jgi:hypothetical protein